jgi:hypothetical protein
MVSRVLANCGYGTSFPRSGELRLRNPELNPTESWAFGDSNVCFSLSQFQGRDRGS